MNNSVKIFAVLLMTLSIFCAGCFQVESDLKIDSDGKVTFKNEVMGVAVMREPIETFKNELERGHYATEITPIAEGNMSGYRIVTQYNSIEQLAAQDIGFFKRTSKNKGIQQHKGWFFDAYNFDLLSEAPENAEYVDNPIAQSMMSQIKFNFVMNLPYAVETTNAQNVFNENKTLAWNLTSSLIGNKNISMQAQFKIWHKDKIILTVAAILILLGGTIYFFQKAKNYSKDGADAAKNIRYMQICAGLAAAIISASTYTLIAPVNFTDADIISKLVSGK